MYTNLLGIALAFAEEPAVSTPTTPEGPPPGDVDRALDVNRTPDYSAAQLRAVVFTDGQVLRAEVTPVDEGYRLRLTSGAELVVPLGAVRTIVPVGLAAASVCDPLTAPRADALADAPTPAPTTPAAPAPRPVDPKDRSTWPPDPNGSRYFYAPTARMLGQGNGYLSQKELAFTTVSIGAADFLDVQVGTVVPLLFVPSASVGIVAAKVGLPESVEFPVRFAVGAQAFLLPGGTFGGFVFGGATVGSQDSHVTLDVGSVFATDAEGDGVIVVAAGAHRVSPTVSLITENWFMTGDLAFGNGVFLVPSGGVRLFGPKFSTDLGLVVIAPPDAAVVIPLPWVDFTWNWSLKKKR